MGRSPLNPVAATTNLVKAYCERGLLSPARRAFDEMPNRDIVAWTAMISGYTSNGCHQDAWDTFRDAMGSGVGPNAFTLSSVLKACKGMEWRCGTASVHGLAVKLGVDRRAYVENALLDAYAAACGSNGLDDACKVFEGITERTPVSWTTMIAAHIRWGDGWAAQFQQHPAST